MTLRVEVTTILPCTLVEASEQVRRPRLMEHVSWPLTVFAPLKPPALPAVWEPGEYLVRMWSFGVVPLGTQTISISFPPGPAGGGTRLRDNGSGQLLRRWDHLITMEATEDGLRTRYTDRVDIDAGWATPLVWAWANVLYRWRQYRWHGLVARAFRY